MRALWLPLLLCLVFFSCQQRYGHVKKVKGHAEVKTEPGRNRQAPLIPVESAQPTESEVVLDTALTDTLHQPEEELKTSSPATVTQEERPENIPQKLQAPVPLMPDTAQSPVKKNRMNRP